MAKKAYIGVGGIARKVKKGYVGVNSVKYTLRNIAPTINGKTGFNAGSASTTHTKYASSSLMLAGTTSTTEVTAMSNATYPLVKGHKYYARVEIYQESVIGSSDFYWPVAEPSFYNGKVATAGKWKIISTVSTRSSWDSGSYNLRLDFNNNNNAGYMWFDGLMLIDLTEAFGEGNEPTATWMKKNVPFFTGTLDIEKKITEGIARPIKKAYIGIGGVARPCFFSGLEYYGALTPLSAGRSDLAAATVGSYALFGGGYNSGYKDVVDAYSSSLIRSLPTVLSKARNGLSATSVGDYALFGGGYTSNNTPVSTVDAYNSSLTRRTPTALSVSRRSLAAVSVGKYALFGGGGEVNAYKNNVEAYNSSLTRSIATTLSTARKNLSAAAVGSYGLFGGGFTGGYSSVVDAYDSSLTRSKPTGLSVGRYMLTGGSAKNHALFVGGQSSGAYKDTVDAYDSSLTRTTPESLSIARAQIAATTLGGFALFGGGYTTVHYGVVEVYDQSLTRCLPTQMVVARGGPAAATVGDYALFGGGSNTDAVEAYTIF